jgi:hypothetical protein
MPPKDLELTPEELEGQIATGKPLTSNPFEEKLKGIDTKLIDSPQQPSQEKINTEKLTEAITALAPIVRKIKGSHHPLERIVEEFYLSFNRILNEPKNPGQAKKADFENWEEFTSGKGKVYKLIEETKKRNVEEEKQIEAFGKKSWEEFFESLDNKTPKLERDFRVKQVNEVITKMKAAKEGAPVARQRAVNSYVGSFEAMIKKIKSGSRVGDTQKKRWLEVSSHLEEWLALPRPEESVDLLKDKLPHISSTISRIDALLPQLQVLIPQGHESVATKFDKHKTAFQRIINHFDPENSEYLKPDKPNALLSDVRLWNEFEKSEAGKGGADPDRSYLSRILDDLEKRDEELKASEVAPAAPEVVPTPEPSAEAPQASPEVIQPEPPLDPEIPQGTTEPESLPLPPQPTEYPHASYLKQIEVSGLTIEMLKAIPAFANIEESEGKVAWVLQKFNEVKLRHIKNEATQEFEKRYRESIHVRKWWKNRTRKGGIDKLAHELSKEDFDFEKYGADIENLIYLADAAPEMELVEKNGKTEIVVNYLDTRDIPEADRPLITAFNEKATAYAKLPPKNEWKKHSAAKIAEYQKIQQEFESEKSMLLDKIPDFFKTSSKEGNTTTTEKYTKADAMRLVNDAEFSLEMHQLINNHPNAEIMLKKLAESTGLDRKWNVVKENYQKAKELGVMGLASSTGGLAVGGFAGRWIARSYLVGIGATWALPFVVAGIGATFGYVKGGKRAEETLRREEELMRLGFEDQTHSYKLLPKLNAKFEERRKLTQRLQKETNPKNKQKLQSKIEALNEKIDSLRGTDQNFIRANTLKVKFKPEGSVEEKEGAKLGAADKINHRIAHLTELLEMSYDDFIKTPHGKHHNKKPLNPEEFEAKRKDWAESLEVRLEYTKQKLDEGKITFGKEEGALAQQLKLYQAMGAASAKLLTLSPDQKFNQTKIFRLGTERETTRRGALRTMLMNAETRIANNQAAYIKHQKIVGALTGGLVSGVGAGVGLWASGFYHDSIHAVQGKLQALKGENFVEGRASEAAVVASVNKNLEHGMTNSLIPKPMPAPVEAPFPPGHDAAPVVPFRNVSNVSLRDLPEAPTPQSPLRVDAKGFRMYNDRISDEFKDSVRPVRNVIKTPEVKPFFEGEPHTYKVAKDYQGREHALIDAFKKMGGAKDINAAQAEINKRLGAGWEEKYFSKDVHKGDEFRMNVKDGPIKIERYRNGKLFERLVEENGKLKKLPLTTEKAASTIKAAATPMPHTTPIAPQPQVETPNISPYDSLPKKEFASAGTIREDVRVEATSDSKAIRAILETPSAAEGYGFKGNPTGPEFKKWVDEMEQLIKKENPALELFTPNAGARIELTRTPDGGWFADVKQEGKVFHMNPADTTDGVKASEIKAPIPEAAPVTVDTTSQETLKAFSHFEVTAPTNLPAALDSALMKDPRFAALDENGKSNYLYQLFMKQYIEPANGSATFFEENFGGAAAKNPFKIEAGILQLDGSFVDGEDVISDTFKEIKSGTVPPEARDFRKHIAGLAERLKDVDPVKINKDLILSTLRELKGQ